MLGLRIMTDQTRGTGQRNSHQESRRGIAGLNRSGPRKAGRGRRLRRGKGGRGRGRGRGRRRAWPERSVVSVKEVNCWEAHAEALILQLISKEILPRQDSRTRHTSSRVSLTILFVTILLASLPSPPPSRITRMHASLTTSLTHTSTPQAQAQGPQKADYGNKTLRTSAHAQTRLRHQMRRPVLEDVPRAC